MRTAAHRRRREAIEKEIASTIRAWRSGKWVRGRERVGPRPVVPRGPVPRLSDTVIAMFEKALATANPEFDRAWFRRACDPDAPRSSIEHPNDARARAEARERRLMPADLRALDWGLAAIQDSLDAFADEAARVTAGNAVVTNSCFLHELHRASGAIGGARAQLVSAAFGSERRDPPFPWRHGLGNL